MPDQSNQSAESEERGDGRAAPKDLRRRVLAGVRSVPEPTPSGALHAAKRALGGGGRRAALAALLTASIGAIALAVILPNRNSGTLGKARLAQGQGSARASLHRVDGHAELRLAGMPQPPIGEVYEVWLAGPRPEPRPTDALFNVTSAGTAAVEVPGGLRGVRRVSVTAEPLGGSSHPTSRAILTVALPQSR